MPAGAPAALPAHLSDSATDAGPPPAVEAPAPAAPEAAPPASPDAPPVATPPAEHSFASVDDAVAALKETRAEAAQRRVELKEAKEAAKQYTDALGGYTADEQKVVLGLFKDLSDPDKQVDAARRLAEISERVLARGDGAPPKRPTGEDDPGEQPLTRKEWERLESEKENQRGIQQAIKQIESEATSAGFPPDSEGYTLLLGYMQEPEIAGDVTKAAAKVKAYEQAIVSRYTKGVEANGERWPGTTETVEGAPAEPGAGEVVGWDKARKAARAFLDSRAGQA